MKYNILSVTGGYILLSPPVSNSVSLEFSNMYTGT